MGCSWSVPDAKYGGGFVLKNCWARQRGKLSILDDNRLLWQETSVTGVTTRRIPGIAGDR